VKVSQTPLDGVVVIEPRVFSDDRGFFVETYRVDRYRDAGITLPFVQDNHSRSRRNVLRGLHLQLRFPQGKLVRAAAGRIWDVAVDISPRSPTFKQWFGVELSDDNHRQLYVPPGYAHGFVVLSEQADVAYKCTDVYHPEDERGLLWNDPELNIDWPVKGPIVSPRDAQNSSLEEFLRTLTP
jgi:dTDP-4-dehydrorhamnose 3,5-epimerase